MRALCVLPLAVLMLLATGCAGSGLEEEQGDSGDEEMTAETEEALARGCAITRAQILAAADDERRAVIERALRWFDRGVPYSQARSFEGYRTDCSGFVSMCWGLDMSYSTADFASGGAESYALESYAMLRPGDALVRRRTSRGHMVLFLGWNDESKTSACVIEQNGTRLDMELGARTVSAMRASGFRAIRADRLR
jgi:cell wall-associated NlpC family hydrolase